MVMKANNLLSTESKVVVPKNPWRGAKKMKLPNGLSLRDYFAGIAMRQCFVGPGARMLADRDTRYDGTNWAEVVAANAYEMADAMLAARKPDGEHDAESTG